MQNQIKFLESLNTEVLFKQYGSPIYVYNENTIRRNYQNINKTLKNHFKNAAILYSLKANNNPAIINILRQEGAWANCSTPAEIHLAKVGGMQNSAIVCSGIFQNERELIFGLKNSNLINLDSDSLLDPLLKYGTPQILSFRLRPDIINYKLGIEKESAIKAYKKAQEKGITRFGIQIPDSAQTNFSDILEIYQHSGIKFEFIHIAIPSQAKTDLGSYLNQLKSYWIKNNIDEIFNNPTLIIETANHLISDAGLIISKIDSIKSTHKETYLGTGCGINTLMQPCLHNTKHPIIVKDKKDAKDKKDYQIVGKVCDNLDFIAHDYLLPKVKTGDCLAILNTGAYGFAMSSQYNSTPRCAEVLFKDEQDYLIRKPEKPKDLHLNVIIPKHLKS